MKNKFENETEAFIDKLLEETLYQVALEEFQKLCKEKGITEFYCCGGCNTYSTSGLIKLIAALSS